MMMRSLTVLVMTASGLILPAANVAAAEPPMCAGRVVTIDLNDPAAPDPNRDEADVVLGTPDDDVIQTGGGDDRVCAGAGADYVAGGGGADRLLGGDGDDNMEGQDGADTLRGGDGNDRLFVDGGPFPDDEWESAYGGRGNDYIDTTKGHERVIGGPGRDTANYTLTCRECKSDGGMAGVRVDLAVSGPQDTVAGNVDEIAGIENVIGGGNDDILIGNSSDNRLIGFFGDDTLKGRAGDDYLRGGRGTDTCRGGPGRDQVTRCE